MGADDHFGFGAAPSLSGVRTSGLPSAPCKSLAASSPPQIAADFFEASLFNDFKDLPCFRLNNNTAVIHDRILVLGVLRHRSHLHSSRQRLTHSDTLGHPDGRSAFLHYLSPYFDGWFDRSSQDCPTGSEVPPKGSSGIVDGSTVAYGGERVPE